MQSKILRSLDNNNMMDEITELEKKNNQMISSHSLYST